MRGWTSFIIIVLSLISLNLAAGQGLDSTIIYLSRLNSRFDSLTTEKVYLQLDRSFYFAGDTIWFKAYVVNSDLQPTEISSVLHVDWISPRGKLITTQRIRLTDGEAFGQFEVPIDLPDGQFQVRAYTRVMQNQKSEFFFHKSFDVINPITKTERPSSNLIRTIDLQFFPEGGNLIYGLQSKVAFKAINEIGRGVEVKGKIVNQDEKLVTTFSSMHNGMGIFTIIPQIQNHYEAVLENGARYLLPIPAQTGTVLAISTLNQENILVEIEASEDFMNKKFYLTGQNHGRLSFLTEFDLRSQPMQIAIPKDELLPGIFQITLFDSYGTPLAERMVFNHPDRIVNINIKDEQKTYNPSEPIEMTFHVTDQDSLPVPASISISATVLDSGSEVSSTNNIVSEFLLTSDLKGHIEDPWWYFYQRNAEKDFDLDLVMLTNGWRRFDWSKLLRDQLPKVHFEPETGLTMTGRAIDKSSGKPLGNGQITVILEDLSNLGNIFTTRIEDQGNFTINNINFVDSTTQVWKTENSKGRPVDAVIQIDPVEKNCPSIPPPDTIGYLTEHDYYQVEKIKRLNKDTSLINLDNVRFLDEVIISDKKIKNDAEVTILGANSVSIKPHKDDYAYPPARLLAKYGQGLVVRGSFVIPLSAFRNTPNKQVIEPPYILVDGLAVPDLASVPTAEIDRLEYLSGAQAAVYGHQSVIRIFTKDKNATEQVASQENGVGIQVRYSQGYDLPRVFYKPKYSYKEEYSSRNILTLDWEPTVKTDQYGNATISFYNVNNDTGEITIIIEGMSEETPVYSKIRITNSNP